ncbi:undecaprenyldiphospho-muramoylpentapeptide beta-N-acetylglucosaminyltransferase [Mycobacterium sp. KBS0706]|uniref:undecaprenyldiphospho-muramoylpentapeptide beta-N-acetylglucosaminyltransferase n=1 Tax=Mycobacterium sp. KBS0706 TaxID=2578109 RepID=UPI00110FA15B|nr:undecaprenyldiphospho-muramoylpentapeptide beta-N-acetylglucosaminyltransferase [Mycobacterium sp. KBS0706]TSD88697.1 undecaprenyldiphospho-muramoylpentapeptide beta-N-acetylglucosaminyltransferase [Mycobacterium sp. KBS0706]
MSDARPILLAAGGTGGHVFPAEALARTLIARGHAVRLATDPRGRAFGDRLPEVPVDAVRSATVAPGLVGKLKTATLLGLGYLDASGVLRRHRPAAVVGFGGYPSAPTVLAASRAGIPVLLHEQNALLGRVNRWLAGRAAAIAAGFPLQAAAGQENRRVEVTGNPVRPAIAAKSGAPYPAPTEEGRLTLLVLGGSQGARVFSELIPAAVALLPEGLRARLSIVQQCRPEDIESCRGRYAAIGADATLATFFDDVPERLAAAQLVICRSGASTAAELGVIGRPAILVPYPFAMDDHQTANARAIAASGGGWLMPQSDLTPEVLASRLEHLYTRPSVLVEAAGAARAAAHPDAADRLADLVLALAGREAGLRASVATGA